MILIFEKVDEGAKGLFSILKKGVREKRGEVEKFFFQKKRELRSFYEPKIPKTPGKVSCKF